MSGHEFHAGELGPGTIVGSAAFNMFAILAICVWVIPEGQTRKIKHLRVFFITAFWSIFAYIWLFLILSVISPGVVEVRGGGGGGGGGGRSRVGLDRCVCLCMCVWGCVCLWISLCACVCV